MEHKKRILHQEMVDGFKALQHQRMLDEAAKRKPSKPSALSIDINKSILDVLCKLSRARMSDGNEKN